MNYKLRSDADKIIKQAIGAVMPEEAVVRALEDAELTGNIYIVAVGKAAYSMAKAASEHVSYKKGIVITKYGHVKGELADIVCYEAGHPVLDENSVKATEKVLELVAGLISEDTVLFLLSGGGSALFEKPLVDLPELQDITGQLLACGADINEINTIRKRLSGVKGGRFAEIAAPAKVYSIILSDIVGDPLDMIASGPTVPDSSTCEMAKEIVKKYGIKLSEEAEKLLEAETPKEIDNATNVVIGSVKELCKAAGQCCEKLGYRTVFLTDRVMGEAREVGRMLGEIAYSHACDGEKTAYILGGETVVHLKGNGLGGRNQEIACGATTAIAGLENVAVFSVGSDGTDGPTDAAGGYVDGDTMKSLADAGISFARFEQMLEDNDCYHILDACEGLIKTGPTGTNVNDFSVALIG
ncbi:glycerate kinase type-2 family protein [Butyrivibrio sp. VCB2001]|uniref:glycerate kinase type-2 family protein n=1 Tax=Butyrivibrio sp. VCB2001 TaxID=1280667 RepID=UPI00041A7D3C|nr:glycerate kinase [Butyrivibrio sp. VCB2001]